MTFVGQFIDHDMTFDPTSSLARQQDPESIGNFRVPALDLDRQDPDWTPTYGADDSLHFTDLLIHAGVVHALE